MRVLWVCNIMLPVIAEALHREASNTEGWLSGLLSQVVDWQWRSRFPRGKRSHRVL